jgi:hypothetical protein
MLVDSYTSFKVHEDLSIEVLDWDHVTAGMRTLLYFWSLVCDRY